ncbi:hypothetical protein [Nonomuraea sp. NPDC049625]|uniref:DUF6896 domain-containing protein n=1 Tax=Nonomuraea sp. NPDC049625 TaxID=3155775 RepID=UPI00342D1165
MGLAAENIARLFMQRLKELTEGVAQGMSAKTGGGSLAALLRAVVEGKANRKWQLSNGISYSVHGIGCRIKGVDGAVIDIDVDPVHGYSIFDAQRVLWFAQSIRAGSVTRDVMESQLDELVEAGILMRVDTSSSSPWYRLS